MEKISKDEAAQKVYGKRYASLSAWGQAQIDHILEAMEPKINAPHTPTLRSIDSTVDLHTLETRIRILEEDNGELWQENAELRARLATLSAELNLPDDSS